MIRLTSSLRRRFLRSLLPADGCALAHLSEKDEKGEINTASRGFCGQKDEFYDPFRRVMFRNLYIFIYFAKKFRFSARHRNQDRPTRQLPTHHPHSHPPPLPHTPVLVVAVASMMETQSAKLLFSRKAPTRASYLSEFDLMIL